jgi:hypothetical protein
MVEESGARSLGATRALKARRVSASDMAEASGARSQGATRALEARQVGACYMVEVRSRTKAPGAQHVVLRRNRRSNWVSLLHRGVLLLARKLASTAPECGKLGCKCPKRLGRMVKCPLQTTKGGGLRRLVFAGSFACEPTSESGKKKKQVTDRPTCIRRKPTLRFSPPKNPAKGVLSLLQVALTNHKPNGLTFRWERKRNPKRPHHTRLHPGTHVTCKRTCA